MNKFAAAHPIPPFRVGRHQPQDGAHAAVFIPERIRMRDFKNRRSAWTWRAWLWITTNIVRT